MYLLSSRPNWNSNSTTWRILLWTVSSLVMLLNHLLSEFTLAMIASSFIGDVCDWQSRFEQQIDNRWLDPVVLAVLFISEDRQNFLSYRTLWCGNDARKLYVDLRSGNNSHIIHEPSFSMEMTLAMQVRPCGLIWVWFIPKSIGEEFALGISGRLLTESTHGSKTGLVGWLDLKEMRKCVVKEYLLERLLCQPWSCL